MLLLRFPNSGIRAKAVRKGATTATGRPPTKVATHGQADCGQGHLQWRRSQIAYSGNRLRYGPPLRAQHRGQARQHG
ncbi:hypothetical protein B296_00050107 [Ensete ventricosum]|uniref:Uncharacterized protein n=1 Tax=Ensete ventricosum TaxID=4639 RepID=A0A426XG46_ENSVE|nr:hypothetical protein B296_00050107 [Ensete ventricosum]